MNPRVFEILDRLKTIDLEAVVLRTELDEILRGEMRIDGEYIKTLVSKLPPKQREFLLALLESPDNRMDVIDIEERVWKGKNIRSESARMFVWRLENTMLEKDIPLILEAEYTENNEVCGYSVRPK